MENFFNKLNGIMRRSNAFIIIAILLVVIIALTGVFVLFFSKNNTGTGVPANPAKPAEDGSSLIVNDIRSGEITIPKYDIPTNNYSLDKFENNNGVITYTGGDSFVGIDVSEHQGTIDWAAVKESGVDFVMIRSAFRGSTRGKIYPDTNFEANIKGASDAGLKIGLYFFSQATSTAEAEQEAAYVLGQIGDYVIDYPIVFDWEPVDGKGVRTADAKGSDVTTYADTFCNRITKAGYNTMVYMNKSQAYGFYDLKALEKYDIWIAEYEEAPSFYYNFGMWQYTSEGSVKGIETTVDVNISFKNYKK